MDAGWLVVLLRVTEHVGGVVARLLAGLVSSLAKRRGIQLEVGSLTIKTALQVVLKFSKVRWRVTLWL